MDTAGSRDGHAADRHGGDAAPERHGGRLNSGNGSQAVAPVRILGLAGSLRTQSYNRRLLEVAASLATEQVAVQLFPGLHDIPLFNEDIEAVELANGPVRELIERVDAADGLFISTPEYNHSMPGVLKNAIDWLSRPQDGSLLAGKPVAIIGASTGRWGTRLAQAALRQTLFALEARVITGPALYLASASAAFDSEGRLQDENARAALKEVLAALASQLRRPLIVAPKEGDT